MERPYIIGIGGGSGSGKTSVALKIIESLGAEHVLVLQHDSYYRDISVYEGRSPSEINFDHPDSLESSLLVRHLGELKRGLSVAVPVYDFSTHTRSGSHEVSPKTTIIVDGILIFADERLRSACDLKVFVDAEADVRLLRRIRRDIFERGRTLETVIHQYETTVRPMHQQFVEPSKMWADVIIPRGRDNLVAIDLVVQKVRGILGESRRTV